MNNGQANAVNVVARGLTRTPNYNGQLPTVEELQSALDLLLAGAYKQLAAGMRPGDATIPGGAS